jgi:cytoskeletal protein CcmA (bactofilin family)
MRPHHPDVFARIRTIGCDACLRPIRWWNRRVWLVGPARCVHLQCWKGQLFLKAFVADHIRSVQVSADENSALSRNRLPENELQESHGPEAEHEPAEPLIILLQPADEVVAETRVNENQHSDNSPKLELQGLAKIESEAAGEIIGEDIEIAPSAVVTAHITAKRLKVGGQVNGEMVARERIEVLSTARLRCTITTPTLVVNEGAQFDGDCKMPGGSTSFPRSEPDEAKETVVPAFITPAQKAELREQGYSDDDIALMIPAVAHRILGLQ